MNAKVALGARIILGLIFFVFGLNGFLNFIPQPPLPEAAMGYMGGLMAAGYFFPVLKATETICGLLLLANVATPLVLVILAPIVLQILLFHTILAPAGAPMAIALLVLGVIVAKSRWESFKPLFK